MNMYFLAQLVAACAGPSECQEQKVISDHEDLLAVILLELTYSHFGNTPGILHSSCTATLAFPCFTMEVYLPKA